MPDQPPQLVEQLAAGPDGSTWRARQPDGREVLAIQTVIRDDASRQAALDRLRRLARIPNPHLLPARGWWADADGVWLVEDPEQGVPLPDLPGGGFLSPQQAAALSFGILDGIQALQSEGLNHGALRAENVLVMPDGGVVLTGHQLGTLRFPNQVDLAAEVREAGRLVCLAFGIAPERDARAAPRAIEHAAPALVVSARAIAAGNMGSDVRAAVTALRDTAGPLGGPERLSLGTGELASLVATKRGGTTPSEVRFRSLSAPIGSGPAPASPVAPPPAAAAPPAPYRPLPPPAPDPAPGPAPARPYSVPPPPAGPVVAPAPAQSTALARRSWEERQASPPDYDDEPRGGPNWLLIGGAIVALVVLGLVVWGLIHMFSGSPTASVEPPPSGSSRSSPAAKPSASTSASPAPGPVPTFAPASAGHIASVTLKPGANCSPGASCTLEVVIMTAPAGSVPTVFWGYKTFDPCTGATSDFPGGSITQQGNWNMFDGSKQISLPAAKTQLAVVAISGPDQAASAPILLGTAGSC